MRLKSIKLAGFKSFVDPTTVQFPSNMCAVVGPNGCGKSNVIDAVRWVMGESSAKNLRGESMADVIFNGSVNRQPLGQASIELVFDNQEGRVGGEYASYAEISTKRQVSREGQSEYFLNGTKCRRRDITDIFLGTGLGPRSYAIIEQGMISRLIESKPEELRVFIEEAAGISKYKERRKETESRMRRTMENLERLTDLRDELERQLQHLQRQAKAAEKYAVLKEEERELKAQLRALQWQALEEQLVSSRTGIGDLEVKLEAVQSEHQQVDTALEQQRVEHTERNDAFNKVQGDFYALGAEVARIEQTLQHQQERARQLQEDLAQTKTNLQESESHLGEDRVKLSGWEQEIAALSPQLQTMQSQEATSTEKLVAAEEAMQTWQQQWDEFNQRAAQPQQEAEVQQSRIGHVEEVLQRLRERQRQLEAEQESLSEGPADVELQALAQQLALVETQMSQHEARGNKLVSAVADTRAQESRLAAQLNSRRSEVQELRGRLASLEALQEAALNDGDEGANAWLQSQQLASQPRLLETLSIESGWELAVETVLGEGLQAVCVEEVGRLGARLSELHQGRLMLVDASADAAVKPDGADNDLRNKVRSGGGHAQVLLAGVQVAESLTEALARRASLAAGQSIVTRDGIWLGRNWMRVARPAEHEGGLIRRQEELKTLSAELQAAQAREVELTEQLEAAQRTLSELEAERQSCQNVLQGCSRQHAEQSADLSAHRAKAEQIRLRRESIVAELQETQTLYSEQQEALAKAREILSESIEGMETDSQQREELLARRDSTRAALEAARQQARRDKDSTHELAVRYHSLETRLTAMRATIERTDRQVAQLRERGDSLHVAVAENDAPSDDLKAELERQLELRLQAEGELSSARALVADVEHRMREAEQARNEIEQRAQLVRSELEQARIAQQSLKVRQETLQNQLAESQHTVDDVLQAMPEGANEAQWQQSLERCANRIARLGPINLAAIDEYDQQSERKTYLDAQNEDLTTALETLQSAIRKIDKETRSRFRDTFEQVNGSLGDLFPRLFGGGSAYLEMTGDDLLDTGITIMARPPGKKNATIHLLSGGEKALTAIALVFSIFQLNPAPFCILDEVDAPLDDANTGRYARLVKEMSEKVQLIYITHNKISMEMAEQLMGVTMHEPGVSRLVSVDVDEAAELAAS